MQELRRKVEERGEAAKAAEGARDAAEARAAEAEAMVADLRAQVRDVAARRGALHGICSILCLDATPVLEDFVSS